jgi:hypothetical protein
MLWRSHRQSHMGCFITLAVSAGHCTQTGLLSHLRPPCPSGKHAHSMQVTCRLSLMSHQLNFFQAKLACWSNLTVSHHASCMMSPPPSVRITLRTSVTDSTAVRTASAGSTMLLLVHALHCTARLANGANLGTVVYGLFVDCLKLQVGLSCIAAP